MVGPQIEVADSHGFDARVLRRLIRVIDSKRGLIERTWNEYFR
jgi:uncharacterized protein (UPF0335 family)